MIYKLLVKINFIPKNKKFETKNDYKIKSKITSENDYKMEFVTLEMLKNCWVHIWKKVVDEIDDVSVNDAFVPTEKHMMNCVVLELKRKIRETERWGENYGNIYSWDYYLPTADFVKEHSIIKNLNCDWFIKDDKNHRRGVATDITMKILNTNYAKDILMYEKGDLINVEAHTMCDKWIDIRHNVTKTVTWEDTNYHIMRIYENLMIEKINPIIKIDSIKDMKETLKELKELGINIWGKKVVMDRLNLKARIISRCDATNLKRWDKKTGKTSNKGLEADSSYKYWNGKNSCGWRFGGLMLQDLCSILKMNNINTKGMIYGDMAVKLMKLD